MTRRPALYAATVALVAVTAGCAQQPAAEPAPAPTFSASAPVPVPASAVPSPSSAGSSAAPTTGSTNKTNPPPPVDRRPSGPPQGPSDLIKKTGWVVGTVTTGGSGPCYGLTTDDGTQYALHATDGTRLVKGTRMRIKTQTTRVRIDCGPGRLVAMVAAEPVR